MSLFRHKAELYIAIVSLIGKSNHVGIYANGDHFSLVSFYSLIVLDLKDNNNNIIIM